MPAYGIYVRDATRQRVAQVDDYSQLDLVLRFNAVGSWSLQLPTSSAAAALLTFGGGLAGLIVMRDGQTLLSGPVRRISRQWSANGDVLTVSGPDDLTLLADRLALPEAPPYATVVADVRTGVAETVIKGYVAANLGPSAVDTRPIPSLSIATDAGRGSTVTGRARFVNLLELCQELAQTGGLGMTLLQQIAVGGFPLQFDVYEPQDLSAAALFSPAFGTLSAFSYTQAAAEANYVIVGGGGEGTSRMFRESFDAASVALYGRIETFVDRRDTSDPDELDQAIAEALASKAQRTELQLTPIDTGGLAFGTDYGLGDKVSVILDGTTLSDIVRTLTITLSKDKGETVTPFVGSPALADQYVGVLFRKLSEAQSRLSLLERV